MNKTQDLPTQKWRLVRSRIRRTPIFGPLAGLIGDIQRFLIKKFQLVTLPKILIFEEFEALAPNSAGTPLQRTQLTTNTIHRIFPELNRLMDKTSSNAANEIRSIESFLASQGYDENKASILKDLFNSHGSDKAAPNNYFKLYAYLLNTINEPKNILEIGLGSRNLNVVSNMGVFGKPGASIRAFRDYLPSTFIYGADIDYEALFEDERIQTTWVDQTSIEALETMFNHFDVQFDLVIDDGLHSPDANISTLIAAISRTNKGGYIVIEDISKSSRDIWNLVQKILDKNHFKSEILSGTNADVFLVNVL